ncbi:GNAT family N-acetyltransferase [Sporosarcina sp. FSL K6-1522]|uniref:GNAT family N-acetyltransferase n=1 Tax=Sporosarcina sp. FSL K6-1522 TaxID=2921554 RepID=UPI00315A863C
MTLNISFAQTTDAPVIHDLMIQAFMAYQNETPPSSALEETVQSISEALENGEQALIGYLADEPVAMVRFRVESDSLYFYRLAVIPNKQGQGIAKRLLKSLEMYALEQGKPAIQCKVRMTLPKNIALYQSIGYKVSDEETVYKPNGLTVPVITMTKQLA